MSDPNAPFIHQTLVLSDRTLAWRQDGDARQEKAGILFLPGFFSDMTGSKASFLAQQCLEHGRRLTRFDYRGHGFSSGAFIDGCIGDWLDDSLKVLDNLTQGPQIIVGSSMGGWIMLLLALRRPERVAGLVGIAAAPDFTEDLVWNKLSAAQKQEMQEKGAIYEPSEYGDPVPYTLRLIEEGRRHVLLRGPIGITAPVRLIQGLKDRDVPWHVAVQCMERLQSTDVRLTLIKDGEHRLSRESDLALLWQQIASLP